MTVHVWILCNESAGRSISDDDLKTLVEDAGHSVADLVSTRGDGDHPDLTGVDLVVAAGGDGTVRSAAKVVAGSSTPVTILPLGTANNIATSVGLGGEITDLIASWHHARRVPFDLGYARAGSKRWHVVEGAGAGLIPAGIAAVERQKPSEAETASTHPAREIASAVKAFYGVLDRLEPVRQTVRLDGTVLSEDLLLCEILNIRSVGPNLVLSPGASPSDGFFNVVLAGVSHRQALRTYLEHVMNGRQADLSLPTHHARSITIDGWSQAHVDDKRVDVSRLGSVAIDIRPGACTMLL